MIFEEEINSHGKKENQSPCVDSLGTRKFSGEENKQGNMPEQKDTHHDNNKEIKKLPTMTKEKPKEKIFWKVLGVGFLVLILLGIVTINNITKDGLFNNNVEQETNNNYSINNNVSIEENIENNFDNKFTFNLDIDEELIKNFCNSS